MYWGRKEKASEINQFIGFREMQFPLISSTLIKNIMPQLPAISGKSFLKFLQAIGFVLVRINGSHHRLKHNDGRVTTVPVHKIKFT